MKQRFSSLDVKAIAHELQTTLVPLRVSNIYDLSSRIFLFKFHKPDHREQLIIESGFRCHLTSYVRTTASEPSDFVKRLRKYLKTRRVTKISQVGTDRIIELEFSDGLYKLYFEFYAGGNIVLTDGDLKILGLLRNVEEGAEHERLRVGLQYNLSLRQNYGGVPELTGERVRDGLQKAIDRQAGKEAGKKGKKAGKDALRKALAVCITECPPLLVDHEMHVAGFDSNLKPEDVLADDALLEKLLEVLKSARATAEQITTQDPIKGYILAKPNPAVSQEEKPEGDNEASESTTTTTTTTTTEKSKLLYEDFHPFRPQQFEGKDYTFLEFDGFNKAVDEFFSSIEGQKLESKLHERELAAKKKLEHARKEHANRIGGLQAVQELNYRKAEAIMANVHRVTEAMDAVNGLIAQGMDWGEIALLIEREQNQGNPVALGIQLPLKLYENTVTLLLDEAKAEQEEGDEDNEGYETSSVSEDTDDEDTAAPSSKDGKKKDAPKMPAAKKLAVDIDLGLTAWANSSSYFGEKKSAASKETRTMQASQKALASHERKVAADLKKGLQQEKEVLRPVRKQFWFEKFIYFVSSDGYLVLGGKDATQTEMLLQRWFRKGDVLVHADLKGAVPLFVKNKVGLAERGSPIPPSTLSQAGHLSVSTSEAWDSKAVMSAWWVNADQVHKSDSTGMALPAGVFDVRGKKEYLPPAQLIVGLAVMWEISEESKKRHLKHRVVDETAETPGGGEEQEDVPEEAQEEKEAEKEEIDSDSDEDFPDAKIGEASEDEGAFDNAKADEDDKEDDESEAEAETVKKANPLQLDAARTNDSDADSHSEHEEEDEVEKKQEEEAPKPKHSAATAASLQPDHEDSGSIADTEQPQHNKPGRRHLSARERRILRKGGQLPTASTPDDDDDRNHEPHSNGQSKPATTAPSIASTAASKPTQLPRGKRAKAKKLASKYADQDDEERALAMRLLGSQSGQKAAEDAAKAQREKEEEEKRNKERRRAQHLRAQTGGKKGATGADATSTAGEAADDEIAGESFNPRWTEKALEGFTGRPLPGDELLSALPVCAPWSALATYKWKAKLVPGSLKRGKAVKEILAVWDKAGKDPKILDKRGEDTDRPWPREAELVGAWKEIEVVGCMSVGKVRVMMQGAQKGGGGGGKGGDVKGKKSARGGRGSKRK